MFDTETAEGQPISQIWVSWGVIIGLGTWYLRQPRLSYIAITKLESQVGLS